MGKEESESLAGDEKSVGKEERRGDDGERSENGAVRRGR